MAFNHVGKCSCPVGDCDCGVNYEDERYKKLVFMKMATLYPTGIYMNKVTGELSEAMLAYAKNTSEYTVYIGEVGIPETFHSVMEKTFILFGYMELIDCPSHLRADLLRSFIRTMCDCSKVDGQALKLRLNKLLA